MIWMIQGMNEFIKDESVSVPIATAIDMFCRLVE